MLPKWCGIAACCFFISVSPKAQSSREYIASLLRQPNFDFEKDYLMRFQPRAHAIRNLFLCMSSSKIAGALRSVVNMLHDKPWFYFDRDAATFNPTLYAADIADQCSTLSEFLQKARVDRATQSVFVPNYYGIQWQERRSMEQKSDKLFAYLKDHDFQEVYDFYAFCFDGMLVLFNQAILEQDHLVAGAYYRELECIIRWLATSPYEADYQLAVEVAAQLLQTLQQKISGKKDRSIEVLLDATSDSELEQALADYAMDER